MTLRPCPYPTCGAVLSDGTAPAHFLTSHRRATPEHPIHVVNRIEACKLCPDGHVLFAMGCEHVDLGLEMMSHVHACHPEAVKGANPERARLTAEMRRRLN